tara:strand:- start:4551 stop:6542 length:1992 start_codon:yes stop_codon:yes gene_type:complete
MIGMNWFSVIKKPLPFIPEDNMPSYFLFPALMDEGNFNTILDRIKTSKKFVKSLRGTLSALKDSPEKYYEEYDTGEATLEQFTERFNKLKELISEIEPEKKYLSENEAISQLNMMRDLINNGKNNEAKQKFAEFSKNTPKYSTDSQYWKAKPKLQQKYLFVSNTLGAKNYITFKNPPENKNLLRIFAELIGGELSEGIILTDFDNFKQLQEKIRGDSGVSQFYSEHFAPILGKRKSAGLNFVEGGKSSKIPDNFLISDKKFTAKATFDANDVFKFIDVLNSGKFAGKKDRFLPKEFPDSDETVPDMLFLTKSGSGAKSVVLNPMASLILKTEFKDDWFSNFFNEFRINETQSDEEAELEVIDDITESIFLGQENSRKFNVSVRPFINELVENKSRTDTKAARTAVRKEIRNQMRLSRNIKNAVTTAKDTSRRQQLTFLKDYFTISEFKQLKPTIEKIYGAEDLEYQYIDYSGENVEEDEMGDLAFYVQVTFDDGIRELNLTPNTIIEKIPEDVLQLVFSNIPKVRDLITGSSFPEFVKQKADEMDELINSKDVGASPLEQLNPKNFISFLSRMADHALNDMTPKEVFKSVKANPQSEEVASRLQDLDKKIPDYLKRIRNAIIKAFEVQMKDIAENYEKYMTSKNIQNTTKALNAFKEEGLLED